MNPLLKTLSQGDYGVYTAGNTISLVGNWMQRVVIGWLAWKMTESGAWLGAGAFADMFPAVILAPVGGVYNESLPISIALEPKTMLAYGVAGDTLPLAHGFPLRVVIARLLGYKNAKYVDRIELTDAPVNGFWVNAGYPYDGEVPEQRLREGKY